MALMATLRFSSRSMASMLDFWTKKINRSSDAKHATMIISKTVKPFFVFMLLLYHSFMV